MLKKLLVCLVPALASGAAFAQAGPVAKVTSDQLVCQLSGDCGGSAVNAPDQDKPDSRGFSIAKRPGAAPVAAVAAPSTKYVAPAARTAGNMAGRFHVVTPAPTGPVGRADLRISFVSGSAELTSGGKDLAQTFLTALRSPQLSGKRFLIAGHTDAVGSRAYNLDLSQRRAQSLVDYLAAQGINRSQFDLKGYGFDRPAMGNSPKSAGNRRVEVIVIN